MWIQPLQYYRLPIDGNPNQPNNPTLFLPGGSEPFSQHSTHAPLFLVKGTNSPPDVLTRCSSWSGPAGWLFQQRAWTEEPGRRQPASDGLGTDPDSTQGDAGLRVLVTSSAPCVSQAITLVPGPC